MGVSKSRHLPPALKDLKKLDPEEFENYKKAFNNGGMSELKRKVDEDIDKWKNVPVNIAVTGNAGVGKSSFINSFRGLRAKSEEAAAVGVVETTAYPTMYMHPINKNIALWDLPGVGTRTFPKDTYLQEVSFENYDYFLIITATRFTENDVWLAKEVQKLGKKIVFIRSKMSNDVIYDRYDNPGICKDVTVSKVRQEMARQVSNAGFENFRVFLIDNDFPLDYDFPCLIETMINEWTIWKQEAMTFKVDLKQYINIMGTSSSKQSQPALKMCDTLKMSEFNIAITGNAGVGKSSLINSLRGLKANCQGAAAVGVDETTESPMKYIHPYNDNIALWDLPGMGTQRFPKSTYLKDVGLERFDFFLIITATRFTENDMWLANEATRFGKKFYFIRTKMELDVENDKFDNPEICKAATVSKVRTAMARHVANAGFEFINVFLIDSHFPQAYDFPMLINAILFPSKQMR